MYAVHKRHNDQHSLSTHPCFVSKISVAQTLILSGLNLRCKERGSLRRINGVSQMGSGDNERAIADKVTHCTEDFDIVLGVVGDLTLVLEVTSEAEENNPLDLVLDFGGELLDSVVNDGTALTVYRIAVSIRGSMFGGVGRGSWAYLYPPATI